MYKQIVQRSKVGNIINVWLHYGQKRRQTAAGETACDRCDTTTTTHPLTWRRGCILGLPFAIISITRRSHVAEEHLFGVFPTTMVTTTGALGMISNWSATRSEGSIRKRV